MAFISSLLLEHVKTHYLSLHYEVCGFVLPTSSGEVSLEIKGQGDPASSRPNCILPHYTNYIWHTHIYGSKSYPSAEDILKVMKKRKRDYQQTKAELIFTPWGIWENSCSVFGYFSKSDIDVIEKISEELYRKTERGRIAVVDPLVVSSVMTKIMQVYPGLRIDFTPWSDTLNGYKCKTF
jgi:hypothetical protein